MKSACSVDGGQADRFRGVDVINDTIEDLERTPLIETAGSPVEVPLAANQNGRNDRDRKNQIGLDKAIPWAQVG